MSDETDPATNEIAGDGLRLSTDAERKHLKSVTRLAIHSVGGGDALELATRVKQGVLSKYGNTNFPDTFIPLDVALDLDRLSASPLILTAYARLLGYRLVPCAGDKSAALGVTDAHDVAKETSDVVTLLLEIISRGKPLGEAGRRAVLKEVSEAKASLNRVLAKSMGDA